MGFKFLKIIKYGIWVALAFCIISNFAAAFVIKEISLRAGIETFVIAVFVIVRVKVAPFISRIII